ncbi:MAG TPA: acetylxylan esterase [Candidatus Sulfotelmatobacter sp.]|nr:acetylxylan esterase [Candidatus Sulfotelmatobacter sp.]
MNVRISCISSNFARVLAGAVAVVLLSAGAVGPAESGAGDRQIADYFKDQTDSISSACLSDIHSLADWEARRPELQREAREMLGLEPMPERTPLHPVITGKIDAADFTVEKIYFQSMPHLYVTADLYLPKPLTGPAPAVLYLCGHTEVISNGVSYGNKTAYQHHGIWFARNGYVCMVVDTLQYGEILGHHRGTYDEGAWWWNSRGYTPASVETWNAIRALDYLDGRPEVDTNRIGVTGRSGGGAYSWFLAAVDDRVKVIAPVAGIGDLESYCVDGTVDDHCDCMFFVNTYRWDYPLLAALCAPRPLLLADTDADEYFPLHGVLHTRDMVKRIYDLYGASTNFGLVIAPGPHKDTQDVQVPVFRWFNIHLKHEDPAIDMAAVKMFTPQELKVFNTIPDDQINARIEYTFEPEARAPEIPATTGEWEAMKARWMRGLREKCFAGWVAEPPAGKAERAVPAIQRVSSRRVSGIVYDEYEIQSQTDVTLPVYVIRKAGAKPRRLVLQVADASFTNAWWDTGDQISPEIVQDIKADDTAYAIFFPRGIGPAGWSGGELRETQLRRRFMLVGQTLDGMRVWDICRAIAALKSMKPIGGAPLTVEASGSMGVNALYASLFAPGIDGLRLEHIPASQMEGPDYLNVLKILDIPEAAAMAAERCPLQLQSDETNGWEFLRAVADSPVGNVRLKWDN